MVFRDLPNAVLIGEPTFGIFSEGIPRQIPIRTGAAVEGWALTVSTQRLFSSRGEWFERRGVPPTITRAPDRAAFEDGRDTGIEAALEFLQTLAEPAD